MNILFLTIGNVGDLSQRGIYTDLIRKFRDEGHSVSIVSPVERKFKQETHMQTIDGTNMLKVFTLNLRNTNVLEKGIGTLLIEYQFLNAIRKKFRNERFDLVLYSTPPITFTRVINFLKRRDQAITYLLLKDIFPQNAVDIGMIKRNGLLHKYFRAKEKGLYRASDYIGCMSKANVDYVLEHNPELLPHKVEINPNSLEGIKFNISESDKVAIRREYNLPEGVPLCIYGGNLGKPQGIDFLISVLQAYKDRQDIFFVVVGSGTEANKVKFWFASNSPKNSLMLDGLPKLQYDRLLSACHIGLIFLDKRFTIPNFPSRLLSYLELSMPIMAATDTATDIGTIAESEKFGFWSKSGDLSTFKSKLELLVTDSDLRVEMGSNGYRYMLSNYLVEHSYQRIVRAFNGHIPQM